MLALKCIDLGKAFGRRWLFRRLSFTVPQGTGLVILGPNGSGKTTLLRLMCGLMQPTEGKVVWEINDTELSPKQVRSLIGIVLPDCEPYDELTAEENMELIADLHGVDRSSVNEWLERVGLARAKRQFVGEFSSGMRLRLKLAMSLVHEPMALLLDEPTAMLDEQGRQLVSKLIEEQKRKGIVIIATNDERDAVYGEQQIVLGKNH
ncbi:MAG: ABC transporter ATP-binding protein [Armatimonadetes bacterium]|nr:ABC transporter ATP-binding protein [Armatimonadota bacterium]